jgi:hypothetical protein
MKRKFVTLALLGLAAALSVEPAIAGTRHVTTKTEHHVMSERARNAHAYAAPPVVGWPTDAPYGDEALSPPAGH